MLNCTRNTALAHQSGCWTARAFPMSMSFKVRPAVWAASWTPSSKVAQLHWPLGIEVTIESFDIQTDQSYIGWNQVFDTPKWLKSNLLSHVIGARSGNFAHAGNECTSETCKFSWAVYFSFMDQITNIERPDVGEQCNTPNPTEDHWCLKIFRPTRAIYWKTWRGLEWPKKPDIFT